MSLISRNLLVLTNMSMSLSPNLKCHITTFSDLNAIIEYSASHLRCEEDTFCLQAYEINRLFLKTQANEHAISEIHKKLVTLIFVQNQIELNIEILKCNLAQIDQSLVILERCECGEKSSKSVITDTYRTNMYNLLQTVAFSLDNLAQLTDEIDCYKATSSNTYNDIERVGQVMQCHLKSLETIEMKIEKLKSVQRDVQINMQRFFSTMGVKGRQLI
ncbi:uncharacterized protein LOC132700041 isoform X1 [Cylas formicarius]|uniref:uncharacterized protein LOC132700041 isoform X1 n=1 Tax=Cylas formicarius TaxID=197179 RepID=UPI002958BF8F|nr:uncharacterized protein LOC132700041 isoform X1 [Cylas formicarius]